MTAPALPAEHASRAVFLAWGPPAYTMRTRLLAKQLGIEVRHVYSTRRRGALVAPLKYGYQALVTTGYLLRRRPRLVFVQNPPGLAVAWVALYCAVSGARFVADAHSDAFMSRYWSRPEWLYRILARRALATVVTNDHFADIIRGWGARACVIRDIPAEFDSTPVQLDGDFNVAVVTTFAPDEPIDAIFRAAASLPEVRFRVTGDHNRENATVPSPVPPNVELTGFLPDEEYYGLLRGSDAAMVLTTRDHTMQRGACEALSVGTPIITSDWPLLVDYFRKGTVHVDNTADGIGRGVKTMWRDLARYRGEILELRDEVGAEWERARGELVALVVGTESDG